jgi:hypothetical protein
MCHRVCPPRSVPARASAATAAHFYHSNRRNLTTNGKLLGQFVYYDAAPCACSRVFDVRIGGAARGLTRKVPSKQLPPNQRSLTLGGTCTTTLPILAPPCSCSCFISACSQCQRRRLVPVPVAAGGSLSVVWLVRSAAAALASLAARYLVSACVSAFGR